MLLSLKAFLVIERTPSGITTSLKPLFESTSFVCHSVDQQSRLSREKPGFHFGLRFPVATNKYRDSSCNKVFRLRHNPILRKSSKKSGVGSSYGSKYRRKSVMSFPDNELIDLLWASMFNTICPPLLVFPASVPRPAVKLPSVALRKVRMMC